MTVFVFGASIAIKWDIERWPPRSTILDCLTKQRFILRNLNRYLGIKMALSIKDPEADRLARAVAARTGETLTQAVINALRDRLAKEERKDNNVGSRAADAMEIGRHYVSQPLLDNRTAEEIVGYDERGLPS